MLERIIWKSNQKKKGIEWQIEEVLLNLKKKSLKKKVDIKFNVDKGITKLNTEEITK